MLVNIAGLIEQSQHLRRLRLWDLYALDGPSWGEVGGWEALEDVLITGIRNVDALALKDAFAEVSRVRVLGSRSDTWIAVNLHNPFRDWDADGAAFGKAAVSAWKKAKTSTQKLGESPAKSEALAILETFVRALNKLDARHELDTLRREEAYEAYRGLANDTSVDEAESDALFDEWRDF